MFTRCPNCQKMQPLTIAQLRNSRAIVFCDDCSILFDALELLSDTASEPGKEIEAINETPITTALPWEKEHLPPGRAYWSFGALLAALLLTVQIVYFEGAAFIQNPKFRPAMEKLCQPLSCQLPVYKNLDEFTVMQGSFTPLPDGNYTFTAVISNQASFAQNYPNIQLILQDYTGRSFTQRIFHPQEYLSENAMAANMPPDATIAISLKIAAPKTPVGGYNFELTY